MEWRGRLADSLAVAAGELLAHSLDHFPLPGNDLKRLGDILAQLRQPCAAAAQAAGWPRHYHAFAWQFGRKWFFNRLPAFVSLDVRAACGSGARRGFFGGKIVFSDIGFQLFKLKLHLVEKPRCAFRTRPELLALHFGDDELEMRDQRMIVGQLDVSGG